MNLYKPRSASFLKIHAINDWRIKAYTLSKNDRFSSHQVLSNAIKRVPNWLQDSDYNIACLIVHEGSEGVFSILNWWVDENMLRNQVFLTPSAKPTEFKSLSKSGLTFCVWELGIIWHERNAWINHVLKHPDTPRFNEYLNDTYSGLI